VKKRKRVNEKSIRPDKFLDDVVIQRCIRKHEEEKVPILWLAKNLGLSDCNLRTQIRHYKEKI
jgi:hypothetical protein